jgi:hypothetical protein
MHTPKTRSTAAFRYLTYMQAAYLALVPLAAAVGYGVRACGLSGACPPLALTIAGLAVLASVLSLCLSSPYLIPLGGVTLLMGLKLVGTADAVGDRPSARRLRWHLVIPLTTIAASVAALLLLAMTGLAVILLSPGGLV